MDRRQKAAGKKQGGRKNRPRPLASSHARVENIAKNQAEGKDAQSLRILQNLVLEEGSFEQRIRNAQSAPDESDSTVKGPCSVSPSFGCFKRAFFEARTVYSLLWKKSRQQLIDSPQLMRMVDLMNKYAGEFPMHSGYIPEIDTTPKLDCKLQYHYRRLLGIAQCICEMGRLDIVMPVSILTQYAVQARHGHLLQLILVFRYLASTLKSKVQLDGLFPEIDDERTRSQSSSS